MTNTTRLSGAGPLRCGVKFFMLRCARLEWGLLIHFMQIVNVIDNLHRNAKLPFMIKRDAQNTINNLLQGFPIVTITGPRQSGKTTLAKAMFSNKPYYSLEDPDVRQFVVDDPRGFLSGVSHGAVLDEIQQAPDLLSYLQTHVDKLSQTDLFLLTGSQHFGLMSDVTQSLAGRTAFVQLLPFSLHELQQAEMGPTELERMLFIGGYPPLYDRKVTPNQWMPAYITAYLERDVRQLINVQDLEAFQRFLRLCAGRSAQVLNLSSLAADCGITHNTAKAWISVLEASFIVFRLSPHHANFRKRLVKSPKIYFYDTGLMCRLLGIYDASQLAMHPLRGAIFETFVVSELQKFRFNYQKDVDLYYWRDSNGREIDVVADFGGRLVPIEIKSGQTLNRDFFSGLEYWMKLAGALAFQPTLIYGGSTEIMRKGIRVLSWKNVGQALDLELK
ncbi:MAG: ATP-binding protein [Desulfohalobiaceae bacterium]